MPSRWLSLHLYPILSPVPLPMPSPAQRWMFFHTFKGPYIFTTMLRFAPHDSSGFSSTCKTERWEQINCVLSVLLNVAIRVVGRWVLVWGLSTSYAVNWVVDNLYLLTLRKKMLAETTWHVDQSPVRVSTSILRLTDDYGLICRILEEVGSTSEIFSWTLGPRWIALALSSQALEVW